MRLIAAAIVLAVLIALAARGGRASYPAGHYHGVTHAHHVTGHRH